MNSLYTIVSFIALFALLGGTVYLWSFSNGFDLVRNGFASKSRRRNGRRSTRRPISL